MKKENIHKFLYAVTIFLILGFIIRLIADFIKYDSAAFSAPLYAFVIARVIEFLIPCLIVFMAARIAKKKYSK